MATFYGWKQRFGDLDVNEAQRLSASAPCSSVFDSRTDSEQPVVCPLS